MERETLEKALLEAAQHMGYWHLHPHQRVVVKHFIKGRDVFVNLLTGSGKSTVDCHWSLSGPESGHKMHLT